MQVSKAAAGEPGGPVRLRAGRALRFAPLVLVLAPPLSSPARATLIDPLQPDVWPGGRAVAVTVSPSSSAVAIVASESGGLFRTTDGGKSWTHLRGLSPFRMADVKYGRSSQQWVIATAYGDTRTGNQGGIWRSTNGGTNWRKPATSNPAAGPKCPANASAYGIAYASFGIFVGTDCGVAISRDNGATWTHSVPDPSAASWRVASVVAHGSGIVDACGETGVYRSIDQGAHWGPVSNGAGGCSQGGTHHIAASPLDTNTLFVTGFPDRLFESTDGGQTWTTLNPPPMAYAGRPSWLEVSAPLPGQPSKYEIFFGNPYNRVRQTCTHKAGLDCVGNWTNLALNPDTAHESNALALNHTRTAPHIVVADAGVWVSKDGGATFDVTGGGKGGFNALQIYDVAGQIHPDHTDLYIGTQDNCLWASPDFGRTTVNPRCPEGFALQMKRRTPADGVVVGVDATWGNFKATDHFVNFDHWNDPPDNAGSPFILDAGVYFQYTRRPTTVATGIALTSDTGGSWNTVRQAAGTAPFTFANSPIFFPQVVGTPARPRLYQAVSRPGSRVGLLRIDLDVAARTATATNADQSGLATLATYAPGQGAFTQPAAFGADPHDPLHVVAADAGTQQIKVTRDGGATWAPDMVLTNLILDAGRFRFHVGGDTPTQVHAIAFDPDTRGRILVGTEAAGLFESFDDGASWAKIPFSDFLIRNVTSFFFQENGVAVVSTYGNGLYKLRPGIFPPPVLCSNPPSPCLVDLRTVPGERIYPRTLCPHPPDLPWCQVYGLEKGWIADLRLAADGKLQSLLVTNPDLGAYDIDGKPVASQLPVQPVLGDGPGEFTNCPACRDFLEEGGTITGFVADQSKVIGIIGRMPNDAGGLGKEMAVAALPAPAASEGPLPYLQLVTPIAFTGQSLVRAGESVEAFGSGFCPTPRCSPVTLRLGERVVASNVRVDEAGRFRVRFEAGEKSGRNVVVRAVQKGEKGEELKDERPLVVILEEDDDGDRSEEPR